MEMINSICKRLSIIKSKLGGNEFIDCSSWRDVIHETFKYYGRFKTDIRSKMVVTAGMDACKVDIDGRVIFWPIDADVEGLIESYFVIFNENNNHYFDIPETPIEAGDIVLDCGACEGYFTKKALERGALKTYCIEPGESIGKCLNLTFADEVRNGRVYIYSYLLGSNIGEIAFYENLQDPALSTIYDDTENAQNSGHVRKIEILTIDEFCRRHSVERIDFIKADIEGGEIELLYGAQETIKRHKPKLAIAAYHRPDHANLIVKYISALGLGYKVKVKGIVDFDGVPRPVMVHCF